MTTPLHELPINDAVPAPTVINPGNQFLWNWRAMQQYARTAIDHALSRVGAEAVAWMVTAGDGYERHVILPEAEAKRIHAELVENGWEDAKIVPLYTTPPAAAGVPDGARLVIEDVIERARDGKARGDCDAIIDWIEDELLSAAIFSTAPQPSEAAHDDEADQLLRDLGLDPERFRTEGGALNAGKIRAALLHPNDYEGLYLAKDSCKRCGGTSWVLVSTTGGLMDKCTACENMRWHKPDEEFTPSGTVASVRDEELPGMWSSSDLMGGKADSAPEPTQPLERRARELFEAAGRSTRCAVGSPVGADEEVLAKAGRPHPAAGRGGGG